MSVHKTASPFGGAVAGTELGPMRITVSAAANERYWASAGADHPTLRQGALYPPVAANLAILLFQTVATRPLLHTSQRLVSHRRPAAQVGREDQHQVEGAPARPRQFDARRLG